MAFSTYPELKASIASWLHRTDLVATIPDFIALGEARIKTMLEARAQGVVLSLPTVAGVATVAIPTAVMGIRTLSIADVAPNIDYVTPDQFHPDYSASNAGVPRQYTTIGDLIYLSPIPDAVYSITCACTTEFTALSDTAPTNALLTKWPNVYLFASLVEAADWAGDTDSLMKWQAKYQAAIEGINKLDWHTAGPMRVRSDVRSV